MADIYLFPAEPNAADVRLREPAAAPVAIPPVSGGGGGHWTTQPRGRHIPAYAWPAPVPVRRTVHVSADVRTRPAVELVVDHAGRRHLEDELLLVGAI
jgi:hypothetical protein